MNQTQGLTYIGNGAFLENVPARDLNADEANRFGQVLLSQMNEDEVKGLSGRDALIRTGLYRASTTEVPQELPTGEKAKEKK